MKRHLFNLIKENCIRIKNKTFIVIFFYCFTVAFLILFLEFRLNETLKVEFVRIKL